MIITIDWAMLINSLITGCITGSVVGAVTGITNWLLNRHLLRRLEQLEESLSKKHEKEGKQMSEQHQIVDSKNNIIKSFNTLPEFERFINENTEYNNPDVYHYRRVN